MQWPQWKWVFGLALALLLLQPPPSAAGQRPMYFRHLALQDGLSQNTITSILQDSQGFVWLGSENGLNRYDGYDIVHYYRDREDPNSLPGNFVWNIAEDRNTDLWIATNDGGIARWSRQSDSFTVYKHDPTDRSSLASDSVRTLLLGKGGLVWVGLTDQGLNVLDPDTGEIEHFRHDPDDPNSLSSDAIYALYMDRAGAIWVGTDAGLNRFNPRSRNFLRYQHEANDPQTLSNDRVRSIYEDHEGALWVGTMGGGLNRLNRFTGRFVRYLHNPEDDTTISNGHVRAIFEDDAQRLWIGTADGLNLLNRDTSTFYHFVKDQSSESLSYSYVMSIYQDRGGLLWVGTRSGGVNIWNPRSWSLGHYIADWLEDTNVTAFASQGEQLWVGTFDRGLTLLEDDVVLKQYGEPELTDHRVMSLLMDRQGALWIGTMRGGLNRLDTKTGEIVAYRHDPEDPRSLAADGVMSLLEDRRGNIWAGTFGGGISRFDPESNSFDRLSTDGGLTSPRATAIAEDLDGNIWIGTDAGLNRLSPSTGEVLQFLHDPQDPKSLSTNTVYALHVDSGGSLWIGTAGGGLNRLSDAGGSAFDFSSLSQRDGLPSNLIYGIRSDVQGLLWLSTNNGIARFDPTTGEIKRFHKAHGLQGAEFNFGAHHMNDWGVMYFGGANGFNAIVPTNLQENLRVPTVILTGVQIMNQPAQTEVPYPMLTSLEVDHASTALTFDFAALDFTSPEKNRYAHFLEGFDSSWSMPSPVPRATYTNLDPGNYVFRVRAANSDGVWTEPGLALPLRVAPAPWETWWAYTAYGAVTMLFALVFLRIQRNKRLKERRYRNRLYRLAYFDTLTGIANRQLFMRDLNRTISKTGNAGEKLALLYIDLDQFKRINDTLGHRVGDAILKLVTKRLQKIVRRTMNAYPRLKLSLSRLGGDEFVVVVTGLRDHKAVDQLARRIIQLLSEPFSYNRYELVVTPSIGISVFPNHGTSVQSLMKNADTALYAAKSAGRSEYKFYSNSMNSRALEDLALEGELRNALDNDELYMVYQPKVDIRSGRIVGAEALLRWQHPDKGDITPAIFIPIAEKSGLILEIDRWVLQKVASQLGEWLKKEQEAVPVAINLSGREFANKNLVWSLSQMMDKAGVPTRYLEIEITEGVMMSDAESSRKTVEKLRATGFNVSIDDFGTGYSSLSYLKSFAVTALKIDRSFVTDLCEDPEDRAICTAIIGMAKGLGIKSIAEGVTTQEQLAFLNAQGCDQAQGFLFHRPLPADEFRQLLDAQATKSESTGNETAEIALIGQTGKPSH